MRGRLLAPALLPSIIHRGKVDFHPAESLFRSRAAKWKRALAGSTQVSKRASERMSEWVHEGFVRISARLDCKGASCLLIHGWRNAVAQFSLNLHGALSTELAALSLAAVN